MTPIKITDHALVQVGKRYALTWGAVQLRSALGNARPIFRMSGGEVAPFAVPTLNTCGYAVIKGGCVVTVLTEKQAFVDCPRAVFTHLIRRGALDRALSLRASYKQFQTKPQDAQSVRYPKACDTIWCAFKFLEAH